MQTYKTALTIAGSDSGGGAGIQADLKTFSALGCYGMSVITALTAQNTVGVTGIHSVPAEFVTLQLEAVLSDIGADAVKIGMLNNAEVIAAVATGLRKHNVNRVVLDPVMTAKSGDKLLQDSAISALKEKLLPLALVATPNIPEAQLITGLSITTRQGMVTAAEAILALGARAVLLKGGHLEGGDSPDYFTQQQGAGVWLEGRRINTPNTHGTGCTLSSAIAACLAQGKQPREAIVLAKEYISEAIAEASRYAIGHGHGPVHHFHRLWRNMAGR